MSNVIELTAKDCHAFSNQEGHGEAIQYFVTQRNALNIFKFGYNEKQDEDIAYFDTRLGKWCAGRYVGEATFDYGGNTYIISITPRFGNKQLFRMLEEVFNVKLPNSNDTVQKQQEHQILLKKIIAFFWTNMLSKANQHGIPKHNVVKYQKSAKIRGKLDVRKSIIPLKVEEKIVSSYSEKVSDRLVANILKKAYKILIKNFYLNNNMISESASNALEQLYTSNIDDCLITERDYQSIRYKSIYLSYRPVVDLSWDIIKSSNFGNNAKHKKGQSFFIDIAEIWEMYLKSILKKHLGKSGWNLKSDKIKTYPNKAFERTLIPDIVFQKGNDLIVWDAKYKKMEYHYFDYDRADFFQIHTYMSYYCQNSNVVIGGLLYPLTKVFDDLQRVKNYSDSLFLASANSTKFIVDGIDYTSVSDDNLLEVENEFLNRISNLITIKD